MHSRTMFTFLLELHMKVLANELLDEHDKKRKMQNGILSINLYVQWWALNKLSEIMISI